MKANEQRARREKLLTREENRFFFIRLVNQLKEEARAVKRRAVQSKPKLAAAFLMLLGARQLAAKRPRNLKRSRTAHCKARRVKSAHLSLTYLCGSSAIRSKDAVGLIRLELLYYRLNQDFSVAATPCFPNLFVRKVADAP